MREMLVRVAGWCVERPVPVIAGAALVAVMAAIGALRLEADAGTGQLLDRDSDAFAATEDFKREFGDDAVTVLVRGDLGGLVLGPNLQTLLGLEACLAGNAADAAGAPAPEPCAALAAERPARVVYGPATFLDQFADQAGRLLGEQAAAALREARAAARAADREAARLGLSAQQRSAAARAAAERVLADLESELLDLAISYGQTGIPRLEDPNFVASVVFAPGSPGQPKPQFSYLFPSSEAALISVRLRPELSESERRRAIGLIRDAVSDPAFRIEDAEYVVSGLPVVVDGLAETLSGEILLLLGVALVVMAVVLALLFGPPLRLLALGLALGAAALVFGLLAAFGGSLTLASLAVLPILIGLSVDYAIQFQARFVEARAAGSRAPGAAVEAAGAGGPAIVTAALATCAGFCALLISPVPMVRGFGLLLVAGIALALALALTAGLAALSLTGAVADSRDRIGGPARGIGRRVLALPLAAPWRVLAVAAVIAVLGWVAGSRTEVVSDIRELVPADLPELRDVDALERATGVSGEVDVTVSAPDVTDPEVVAWMRDYKLRVLERAGFDSSQSPCLDPGTKLCPSIALGDLFGEGTAPDRSRIRELLALLPPYFSQAVVSVDPETGEIGDTAVIAFGIKVMPLDEQKRLIDAIRDEIDPPGPGNEPPEGVRAEVIGLPVLVADASDALSEDRLLLTLAGLAAVALVLLAVHRSPRRALVPLVPIALATGWSGLAVALAGVPLNPMSATLGALVIAIGTEFSVLLSARFEEERRAGLSVGEALRRTYSRTGVAVLASAVTATAGFAVLVATDIRILRDFGIVTVIDLSVALVGVLLVLPAALVLSERGSLRAEHRSDRRAEAVPR